MTVTALVEVACFPREYRFALIVFHARISRSLRFPVCDLDDGPRVVDSHERARVRSKLSRDGPQAQTPVSHPLDIEIPRETRE